MYKGNADDALTIVHPDRGVHSPSLTPDRRDPRDTMPSPRILHSPLFARNPKREYGTLSREYDVSGRNFRRNANGKNKNL